MRWLAILVVLGLGPVTADAQVFKPKGKKTDVIEKKSTKKAPKTAPKKSSKKSKKNAAADRGRPDDLTPEPASKTDEADYVKITDDEDIE